MSAREAPPWLAELQRGFSETMRAPLDRATGTLRAETSRYDAATVAAVAGDAAARLAVYNRQYWFRLFGVLQREMPLAAALTGAWTFNDLAGRFLLAHPPRHLDLARVADGFVAFLEAAAPEDGLAPDGVPGTLPRAALLQAARVDEAFRRVISAPSETPFRPSPEDAARLGRCRLVPASALSIVDEDWALFEMRHALPREPGSRARPLPAPHPRGPRSWAVHRAAGNGGAGGAPLGHRVTPLAPLQASLLRLLTTLPVGAALAHLEADSPGVEPAALARDVQAWLAESVASGFWVGLVERDSAV